MITSTVKCDSCGEVFHKTAEGTGGPLSLTNAIIAAGWHVKRFANRTSMHACSDECKAGIKGAVDKPLPTGWSDENE